MTDQSGEKRWFPLESNPALLNQYASKLGFENHSHEFTDVFSTESWALDMVPQPVSAVVVLFPMTEKISRRRRQLHSDSFLTMGTADHLDGSVDDDVWYVKQRIRNACGTIAVLHALANVPKLIRESSIRPSSWLHSFLQNQLAHSSPIEKAIALESDTTIENFHENATNDSINQTPRGNMGDDIDMHFVSFIHVNGKLYELDGRLEGPICHGSTTQQNLLSDTCRIVKQIMEADLSEVRFTIMAFAPKQA